MLNNLYLWGFMGTGKTTIGKIAAEKLKFEFVDLDEVIEKSTGLSIPQIFKKQGEKKFRELEKTALKKVSLRTHQVISLGGGVVEDIENRKIIKDTGLVVCLTASVSTILKRTRNSSRPLLNTSDPKATITKLLQKRHKYYKQADFFVKTDNLTPEQAALKIINLLKNRDGE